MQTETAVALAEPPAPDQDIPEAATQEATSPVADMPLTDDDLLVEEVSIDGMCGVY